MNNSQIDIILPWVNGDDPAWQREKNKYDKRTKLFLCAIPVMWDNLQYVFRGIEKYMPWVHKVFL